MRFQSLQENISLQINPNLRSFVPNELSLQSFLVFTNALQQVKLVLKFKNWIYLSISQQKLRFNISQKSLAFSIPKGVKRAT